MNFHKSAEEAKNTLSDRSVASGAATGAAPVRERPILFSGPMVRALLAGTKTQTRRICKSQPYPNGYKFDGRDFLCHNDYLPPSAMLMDGGRGKLRWTTSDVEGWESECPYGQPGDRLWVRETWMPDAPRNGEWADTAFFGCGMSPLSDIPECYRKPWHCLHHATYDGCELVGWKPSIHMPRWASRITLEITGVRVERLQDISEDDAAAEGCAPASFGGITALDNYATLWNKINGPGSWAANPWVWVVSFKRMTPGSQADTGG